MKRNFLIFTLLTACLLPFAGIAQQVIITDDNAYSTAASGAMLDVKSTNMGFMPPRVALTASNVAGPVATPSTGLLVYNTATTSTGTVYDVSPGYYYNAGTSGSPNWVQVMNSTGVGTASVWDDLRVPLSEPATGNLKPDWYMFPFGASGLNPFLNWFKASGVDEMYFVVQMPHDWKEGSTIYPHVHWVPSQAGASGPTVPRWGLQCSWMNLGETHSGYTVEYGTTTTTSEVLVANRMYITPLGTGLTATGKKISSMLICRIFRDGDNAADNYAGLAGALEVDFHYEKNSSGSRLQYIK